MTNELILKENKTYNIKDIINILKKEIKKLRKNWFKDQNLDDEDIFREMISFKQEKPVCYNYYETREAGKEFHLFKTLELKEGEEGEGEYCHAVLKFDNGQYFRVNWRYYSYNGEYFEDLLKEYTWEEVKPVEVLKTEYHRV